MSGRRRRATTLDPCSSLFPTPVPTQLSRSKRHGQSIAWARNALKIKIKIKKGRRKKGKKLKRNERHVGEIWGPGMVAWQLSGLLQRWCSRRPSEPRSALVVRVTSHATFCSLVVLGKKNSDSMLRRSSDQPWLGPGPYKLLCRDVSLGVTSRWVSHYLVCYVIRVVYILVPQPDCQRATGAGKHTGSSSSSPSKHHYVTVQMGNWRMVRTASHLEPIRERWGCQRHIGTNPARHKLSATDGRSVESRRGGCMGGVRGGCQR